MTAMVRLADYRPYPYDVESVDLRFELDPDETLVTARIRYRLRAGEPLQDLVLDGRGLRLVAARLDGQAIAPGDLQASPERLTVKPPSETFELETTVALQPSGNTSKQGLFFHEGLLLTHCEPEGFRRITYFPDRPDILAPYTVTLSADAARFPLLLSNGACVNEGSVGGRHWRTFRDPIPKPTYIFAAFAGDMAALAGRHRTASGRSVELTVYATARDIDRCGYALEALKAALAWDEAVFGLEYDLDSYGVVAIPAYAGAHENKGLNFLGVDLIVAEPSVATDEDYELVRRIVGHEAFHNWTGNRVTCRDWFQLSLKEGLTRLRDQLFMEDALESGVYRIDQVRALRRNQFPEDDGPAAHPIQPPAFVKIENFYTNTVYEKGAEVLRMLRTILTPEGFVAAIRLYLTRHDGQAVTLEALFAAAEDACGVDLGQFRRWATQPGRPRLAAHGSYDPEARAYRLTLRQTPASPAAQPLHMPVSVALVSPEGVRLGAETLCELKDWEQTFEFADVPVEPIPSLLRGFSAPVSLECAHDAAQLACLAAFDDDPFVAWDSLQTLLINEIRRLAAAWRQGVPLQLSDVVESAFGQVLRDETRGPRLRALLLGVPDEPVLSEGLPEVDLDGHMAARAFLRGEICRRFRPAIQAVYQAQGRWAPSDLTNAAVGGRMLRNAALDLLVADGDPHAAHACFTQVTEGPSMTESFEALCILSHLDTPLRTAAFQAFYARRRDEPQLVDKWFKAMALSRAPGAVDEIVGLADHPDLAPDNTSRNLAFFGSFFRQNRVMFHDLSGKGYAFLADRLIAADRRGSGRPGYLMAQIDQWRRYSAPRRDLMRAALRRVIETPDISAGLEEVVRRSLGD
ncbi:aminopeptidase N [Phenylobacterium sp. SCN 70-31]|uniref:aminopeptidase N n=1 Tax=Phenylobacterium sp. SCN 70-31 TaxID=1660129 RepID=UPI00086E21E7|nr:aminopeptidase N [Phenylobacterium sp. SCN 70-31]ODT88363.1 MAG: aminopeptidase N [Phenylobacterium sp. SCN 70-31]